MFTLLCGTYCLFREKHIGMHKALVAAEQVQILNPALKERVHGMTHKLGSDAEHIFSAAFWRDADLVVTALVSDWLFILMSW